MGILRRIPLSRFVIISLVALASVLIGATTSLGFQVKDYGVANLDGKVVMSPAAERIQTIDPKGGELISPGSVVKRPIIIHNRTKDKITFNFTVSEVVGSSADLIVEVRDGVRKGAAAWAELEKNTFTLKPGQQGTMYVTIRIPKSVKPGSKSFAVTATQQNQQVQAEGAGVAPQFKQVAIFIIDLPGDAPVKGGLVDAMITSAQKELAAVQNGKSSPRNSRLYISPNLTDKQNLTLSAVYKNKGERLLQPNGRVVVRDLFGRIAGTYEIPKFTVYPDGEAAQTVSLKNLPTLGIFRAKVELESEEAGKQTTTLPRFALIPKWFLIALTLLVLFAIWKTVRWRLGRQPTPSPEMSPADESDDYEYDYEDDQFGPETY